MKTYIYTLILFCSPIFFACQPDKNIEYLQKAQALAENNPKEALIWLDSIKEPQAMGKNRYMQYIVTRAQAKYKDYQDITNDTELLMTIDYFEEKNDIKNLALANYYTSKYYIDSHIDSSLYYLYSSAHNAEIIKDYLLVGKSNQNIARLYSNSNNQDSAIAYYRKALDNYNQLKEFTTELQLYQLDVFLQLGYAYRNNEDYKTAYKYIQEGIKVNEKVKNQTYQSKFELNLGILAEKEGEYKDAKHYYKEALNNASNTNDSVNVYLNQAILYNTLNKQDSVSYYLNIVKQRIPDIENKKMLVSIYEMLFLYNNYIENYKEALYYNNLKEKTEKELASESDSEKLLKITHTYQDRLKDKDTKAKQERIYTYAGAGILFLVLIIISIMRHQNLKHKHRQEVVRRKLAEFEKELLDQQSINLETTLNNYEGVREQWSIMHREAIEIGIDPKYIDRTFEGILENTNRLFAEWTRCNIIAPHRTSKRLMLTLTSEDLCLLGFTYLEYSYEIITKIMGFDCNCMEELEDKVRILRNKLLDSGMTKEEINQIFDPSATFRHVMK